MENIIVAPDGTVYFRDSSEGPKLYPGEFVAHRRKYVLPKKEDVVQV